MCGRYDLNASAVELVARFGVTLLDESAGVTANVNIGGQPRYNIAPRQHNPVVVRAGSGSNGHNQLELMQWGLVPAWSREAKVAYSTINARAETIASKPTFRKPLATQRCLVPATGYFEWVEAPKGASANQAKQENQGKQPYRIRLRGKGEGIDGVDEADGIFAFAGLYDLWQGPGGEELQTYTIVTTKANDALSAIHSRMPVILPRDVEEAWLDRDNTDIEKLISLLQPYSEEGMIAYPVSRLVNSPMNEGRELIEPLSRLAF